MRYADRILFVEESEGYYDPDLGEHVAGRQNQVIVPAFVTDLGIDRSQVIFGDYQKDRKIVYLQRPYPIKQQVCRYNGKTFKVVADRQADRVFYLEGDGSSE